MEGDRHSINAVFCILLLEPLGTERGTMIIRKYQSSDCESIARLFYETVHEINAKDYTKEQLNAWAGERIDLKQWDASFLKHHSFVAVEHEMLVGFGDMDQHGYLERLFVHKDYQRKGIATAICDRLEGIIGEGKIITHASITAKPFFEKRGYRVVKQQQVQRQGISLINYIMVK